MISSAHWSSPGKCLLVILALQPVGVFVPVVSQALDINCLELLTIVVALKLWGHLWRGLRLAVRCENFVAVTALNSGSCRNTFVNSCLRQIVTWPLVSSLNCARFTFLVPLIVMPTCFRVGVRVLRTNNSFYVCNVTT